MNNDKTITPEPDLKDIIIGEEIVKLLGLKVKANGRVDTSDGDKTMMGLARTVRSLYDIK